MDELSRKEHAAFLNHLEQYGERGCPYCGHHQLSATEAIVTAARLDRNKQRLQEEGIVPMLQAACHNCGYMMLFAANHVDGVNPSTGKG